MDDQVTEQDSLCVAASLQDEKAAFRAKIARLESELFKGETVELPVKHHFSKGVYARELLIPAGTTLTGKIHKHENLNIISRGDISVLTEEGVKRLRAPCTFVSPPGTKRVGFAHEDTIWLTIHGTDETDLEKIEAEFIAKDYDEVCLPCSAGNSPALKEN